MKGWLLLLVFAAAGLGGVLYWRHSLHAPAPAVAPAGDHAKKGKERHRRKRGARRLARNEAFVASGSSAGSPSAPGEGPSGDGTLAYGARPEEKAPLAPGGSAITEAAPSDVFGPYSAAPSAGGGRRQVVDEPEPVKLRPADLKIVWQGEDLGKQPENMRLDFSNEGGRELSQDEIDARFRAKEDAVLGCVARARPDEYTYVPGRINVRFRIQRTGVVKGVQVEAPAILHRGGLMGCIKGVLATLRFPASNSSQVITYPFSLL